MSFIVPYDYKVMKILHKRHEKWISQSSHQATARITVEAAFNFEQGKVSSFLSAVFEQRFACEVSCSLCRLAFDFVP